MGLAVIGSGFGRTGTMSLKAALDQLGFGPCHHMEEILKHPDQVPYWQAVAAGKAVDWNEVFRGYRAQVDWPGAHVWRELAVAYPEAKVVHSIRPETSWWNSFSATIGKVLASYSEMSLPPHVRAMCDVSMEIVGRQTFGVAFADGDAAIAAYRRRTEEVRATIAPERLLVFDVAEGWEPLCRFLGVPEPDSPFPHHNTTAEFWEIVKGAPH
jgi:hypothetical protein